MKSQGKLKPKSNLSIIVNNKRKYLNDGKTLKNYKLKNGDTIYVEEGAHSVEFFTFSNSKDFKKNKFMSKIEVSINPGWTQKIFYNKIMRFKKKEGKTFPSCFKSYEDFCDTRYDLRESSNNCTYAEFRADGKMITQSKKLGKAKVLCCILNSDDKRFNKEQKKIPVVLSLEELENFKNYNDFWISGNKERMVKKEAKLSEMMYKFILKEGLAGEENKLKYEVKIDSKKVNNSIFCSASDTVEMAINKLLTKNEGLIETENIYIWDEGIIVFPMDENKQRSIQEERQRQEEERQRKEEEEKAKAQERLNKRQKVKEGIEKEEEEYDEEGFCKAKFEAYGDIEDYEAGENLWCDCTIRINPTWSLRHLFKMLEGSDASLCENEDEFPDLKENWQYVHSNDEHEYDFEFKADGKVIMESDKLGNAKVLCYIANQEEERKNKEKKRINIALDYIGIFDKYWKHFQKKRNDGYRAPIRNVKKEVTLSTMMYKFIPKGDLDGDEGEFEYKVRSNDEELMRRSVFCKATETVEDAVKKLEAELTRQLAATGKSIWDTGLKIEPHLPK